MAIRKEIKKQPKPYSWENLPKGKSEPASGKSKVVQTECMSISQTVRKILNGDIAIKHQGYYDSLDVKDVPPARQKNANLISVTNAIRSAKISDAINNDIKEKLAKKSVEDAQKEAEKPQEKAS